jgi:hypothetical protein
LLRSSQQLPDDLPVDPAQQQMCSFTKKHHWHDVLKVEEGSASVGRTPYLIDWVVLSS